MEQFRSRLQSAARKMGLSLTDATVDQLLAYLALFAKWNRAYNLSAIRDPAEMLERHLVDSLSVVDLCGSGPIIDVGTGGGLPGIPLAICHPERPVTLLDANGKKTRFLFQVATELGLANVTVVNERVEAFRPQQKFDGVVSRAFASLRDMIDGSEHLLTSHGKFYAMKGKLPTDELSELPKGIKVEQTHPLTVPGCDAERHLIVLAPER